MENWQKIIDAVYEYWQNNDVSYGQVLEYANTTFGDIGELAILLKNYNYQVCNGGHLQYFENGYCQPETGFFAKKDYDIPLHYRMIELFEKFGLYEAEQGKPIYDIMTRFNVLYEPGYYEEYEETCGECDGNGYLEDDEEGLCPACGGDGYWQSEEYIDEQFDIDGQLDDDYYEVNQPFLEYFEEFIGKNYV